MPLPDTMYCAQQIRIPPELPDILKQFTKAAIRTQPQDVLQWSAVFSALSKGEPLPVKDRLEMSGQTNNGLTPGLLKVLHKQELQEKWRGLSLSSDQLDTLLALGSFSETIDWMQFFALGCSALGGTIMGALKHACEILTQDPEGGAARIPYDAFVSLFTYLAHVDGEIPQDQIDSFLNKLQESVQCCSWSECSQWFLYRKW
uniref:Ropporin-1-like protein n=1 Tax=Denticeps clupeoides TaxID=299321 RepID=A0AAY4AJ64_9TELE